MTVRHPRPNTNPTSALMHTGHGARTQREGGRATAGRVEAAADVRTEPVSESCASCESASSSAPPAYSCAVSAARSYRYRRQQHRRRATCNMQRANVRQAASAYGAQSVQLNKASARIRSEHSQGRVRARAAVRRYSEAQAWAHGRLRACWDDVVRRVCAGVGGGGGGGPVKR